MHELGVTRSIVDVVLRNAQAQQAKQVLSVSLVIGEMRNLEEEWVQRSKSFLKHALAKSTSIIKSI